MQNKDLNLKYWNKSDEYVFVTIKEQVCPIKYLFTRRKLITVKFVAKKVITKIRKMR